VGRLHKEKQQGGQGRRLATPTGLPQEKAGRSEKRPPRGYLFVLKETPYNASVLLLRLVCERDKEKRVMGSLYERSYKEDENLIIQ